MRASEAHESSVDVSIIIVNWNSANYVLECVESIYRETKAISFEIIVIDNASFDGCGEKLAQSYPDVVFIQSDANLGFARANNIAASRAKGRTLLFLNPDTKVLDRAIERLCSLYWKLPNCGVLGCRLLNKDGSVQESSIQVFPSIINQFFDSGLVRKLLSKQAWGVRGLSPSSHRAVIDVDAVSGACMVIRKNLFEEIGGFSDRYFMYGEDVDLCLRVRRKGFTNYHSLDIAIIHYGGGTTPEVQKPLFSALMRQSLYTYFRTNHGRLTAIAFRTAIFLAGITRIGLLLAVWPLLTVAENRYSVRHALCKWASICAWSLGILNPRKLLAKNPADP